ncbi:transcriptional regulator [Mycolicibacterium boenickei]|uniref:Repressor in the phenylacetic acid catabolism n=1 Tax=Mycolicibacterium boenickei TaxID=146017 RepID=A0AAX2ZVY9_9MYCO|nr:PaaX family transcriptional regulator C-terminal domain-containing protein [Mycolicibacterium boenickei]PEG59686.1 transcriptional regulator [Mycolicibacterium boenickei]UNB99294.1 transcriptional regulator [Mycolicibacterium boenickei]BBX88919.1 putative repressor in the phenylacetic acid catabolism [Mycolicibacterium boenickei]
MSPDVSAETDHAVPTRTLVESMLRADATVDAGELYDVANTLGMSDQQVRLCIKRLVAEGQFVQDGRGRKAVLRATPEVRSTIEPDLEFVRYMYAQDRGQADWDGRWHVVAFAIGESARSARDSMRDAVVRLGGAPVQGGLYVSPNEWEPYVQAAADRFGVADRVTTLTTTDLTVGGVAEARALAEVLWPLDRIADGHRRLLATAQRAARELQGAARATRLSIAIELAAEFTRAVEPDPLLPPQLLPQPWIGTAARAAVADCWSELLQGDQPEPLKLFRWYGDVIAEVAGIAGE